MTIFADKERSMMQARRDFKADRPAGYLDRTDFLVLAGLEIPAYYSLRRRGQLPLMPAAPGSPSALLMEAGYPTPDEMPPDWDARGWDPGAALAVIVSTQFVDRYEVSRDRAGQLARNLWRAQKRWPEIVEASTRIVKGKAPRPDILLASLEMPGIEATKKNPDPVVEVGTLGEIGALRPSARSIIAVSLTQAAATLRRRAEKHGIDLSLFWSRM